MNYTYYIIFDKFLGLVCFGIHMNADEHGGLQQLVNRLMHATLQVSYRLGRGYQIIPRLSLTCWHITTLYSMFTLIDIYDKLQNVFQLYNSNLKLNGQTLNRSSISWQLIKCYSIQTYIKGI